MKWEHANEANEMGTGTHAVAPVIEPVVIDCNNCAVRGPGCGDCVVSVLVGTPETLLDDERAALDVLAAVGMAPRLRLVPIKRGGSGIAS